MATFTRKNAWNNDGTFNNPDLLWYAKAVEQMQSRSLNDKTSWWFFAAIHGNRWIDIPAPPNVPTIPLPSGNIRNQYWAQCQHGTWFFLPWHRGYLYAIEDILREIVQNLGGPVDWALPYWNYFGQGNQFQIPPAFTEQQLPDGTLNSLFVNARYGPNNDRSIFIPLSAWGINQNCQQNLFYTGDQPDFFGGVEIGFEHSGYENRGSIESNPHNFVHGAIGGQDFQGVGGLMSNPNTAAIDPVFYLLHCNIDRMWASWNAEGKNNSNDLNWLNGPITNGDRKFYMPKPDATPWQYTPGMVNSINQLDYSYDDLSSGPLPEAISRNELRLRSFGSKFVEIKNLREMDKKTKSELVGANSGSIILGASGLRSTVKLDSKGWNSIAESIGKAFRGGSEVISSDNIPDEVFLQLEGIKGKEDSIVCSVSVNNQYAGHISLFGLQNASTVDSPHGGSGLTIRIDITKIIDRLVIDHEIDVNSLDVLIQPINIISEGNDLTIDRISIYRNVQ